MICKLGIVVQYVFWGWVVDDEVFQIFVFDVELNFGDFFGVNFK